MNENLIIEGVIISSIIAFIVGTLSFLYIGIRFRKKALSKGGLAAYQTQKMFNQASIQISNIVNNTRDLLTRRLIPGGELTHSASEIGLGNIEYLLSCIVNDENNRPYLFGVNKGGAFIANYLSHRMSLHEKYLVKCDFRTDIKKLYCESREITGPIVIIDDVVRTGETLREVKKYLRGTYPNSSIYCIVLVVVDDENIDKIFDMIDYSPWISSDRNIVLPWSRDSKASIDTGEYFDDKEMDQIVGRIKYIKNLTTE